MRGAHGAEVYVDGRFFTLLNADKPRPDVAAIVPHAESNDGFDVVLPARAGAHQVCVYGINMGRTGRNVTLGCRDLDVPVQSGTGAPIGSLDDANGGTARGWSMTPSGGRVRVRVVGVGGFLGNDEQFSDVTGTTGVSRPDVPAAYPGARPDTGYEFRVDGGYLFQFRLACATAQSLDTGAETELGCANNPKPGGDHF
jgi:hypothetical protein